MLINFDQIPENVMEKFKGGEGAYRSRAYADDRMKIMLGRLTPGSSIGLHTHDTSSEVFYILSGTGKVLCGGEYEPLSAGSVHYCPRGQTHSLINDGGSDLTFLAVVPEHGA